MTKKEKSKSIKQEGGDLMLSKVQLPAVRQSRHGRW
jgi:hypothetical protein